MISSTVVSERLARIADAAVVLASRRHKSPLAADVQRLSTMFTSERGSRERTYMRDPALRRAYLGFFVPHNVARIALLLQRARGEGLLPDRETPRVVDVGAGPLTGILACWAVYGRLGPSWGVDLSRAALEDGQELLAAVGADVASLTLWDKSLNAPPGTWLPVGDVDVIIAANVLNELSDPRMPDLRLRVVDACVKALLPGGRLLVVEPSMRVEARSLMTVRDEIVEAGDVAAVLSPCRGAERCPLLLTRGDWCHGEVPWGAHPPAYRELEKAVKLRKDLLSSTHLLLGRPDEDAPVTGLRLVGGVMRAADRELRYACGRELVTITGNPRLPLAAAQPFRGTLVDDVLGAPALKPVEAPPRGTPTPLRPPLPPLSSSPLGRSDARKPFGRQEAPASVRPDATRAPGARPSRSGGGASGPPPPRSPRPPGRRGRGR